MKTNEKIKESILEMVKSQLKENNPPEVKITYDRLIKEGFDEYQTLQLIGQCISIEIFEIIKNGEKYNNQRYVKNLSKLPNEPFE